jgi:hypothetical protein
MAIRWQGASQRARMPAAGAATRPQTLSPRLLLVFGLGVLLLSVAAVAAVLTAGPAAQRLVQGEVPPAASAPGLRWFDPDGAPSGTGAQQGPGLWRRDTTGAGWEWMALPAAAMTQRTYIGSGVPASPAWPSSPETIHVERVVQPNGREVGYWVWNPTAFSTESGASRWSPRWQWTPAGQPLLLTPDPKS